MIDHERRKTGEVVDNGYKSAFGFIDVFRYDTQLGIGRPRPW